MTISTKGVSAFMAKKFGGKGVKFGSNLFKKKPAVVVADGEMDVKMEAKEKTMQNKFKTMKKKGK